jgi:hypothetical protein
MRYALFYEFDILMGSEEKTPYKPIVLKILVLEGAGLAGKKKLTQKQLDALEKGRKKLHRRLKKKRKLANKSEKHNGQN